MHMFGQSGQGVRAMWDSGRDSLKPDWEEEEDADNWCDGDYDRGEGRQDLFQDKDENGKPSWFGDLLDDKDENGLRSPKPQPPQRKKKPAVGKTIAKKPAGSKKK